MDGVLFLLYVLFSYFYLRFPFFFFSPRVFSFSVFLLKRQPSQKGGQRADDHGEGPAPGRPGGPVAAATEFKQTPTEIQVAGFLFQLLPEIRGSLLAVGQRRRGAGVEVIPVTAGRKHSEPQRVCVAACYTLACEENSKQVFNLFSCSFCLLPDLFSAS